MASFDRRNFLKASGVSLLPALIPFTSTALSGAPPNENLPPAKPLIKFFGDGEMFEPGDYLNELQKANTATSIIKDRYGVGGVVEALEKKFTEITGKEKAVFMPSGTMANQLAIAVLSGDNTKVFVQETSHVYRDEADAAQSVFQKRLVPLAAGEAFFTAQQLQNAIEGLKDNEVFKTGIGAVSIEIPVRRADGKAMPLEEIILVSKYCRSNNIRLHLDGARIFMASGWTGVPVKEYASYFDTIYISLYKYFGASAGAVLCGSKDIIEPMTHLIKVHGGSMYGNWTNAAMALYRMEGFEQRLQHAIKMSAEIFAGLTSIDGIQVKALSNGTNIYAMDLAKQIDGKKMQEILNKDFNIRIPRPNDKNQAMLTVNETISYQTTDYIINAFRKSIQ